MHAAASCCMPTSDKSINLFMRMIENRCVIHHNLDAFALELSNFPVDFL
jgi:hypothetical protein